MEDFEVVTKWFYKNHVVLNSGKCHFMCPGKNLESETFFYNNPKSKTATKRKFWE